MDYIKHDKSFVYFKTTPEQAADLGAVYVGSIRGWKLPLNPYTLKELQKHIISHKIDELLGLEIAKHTFIKHKKEAIAPTLGDLRPYQAVDVRVIQTHKRLAIFNEQRTGKTPTILTALQNFVGGIVVCPASLKLNWLKEAERWARQPYVVITGSKAKRKKLYETMNRRNMIISYETLRADINDIMKLNNGFTFLIADEAHRLRNYKTKQSQAIIKVAGIAERIYPMTGTPAVNHAADIFGILKILYPHKYRAYWQFVERYFTVIDGYFGKCNPKIKENYRSRCSALISKDKFNILIDSSPDLKSQLLKNKVSNIDKVFYTHLHGDQTHGINELRVFFLKNKKKLDVFAWMPFWSGQEKVNTYSFFINL